MKGNLPKSLHGDTELQNDPAGGIPTGTKETQNAPDTNWDKDLKQMLKKGSEAHSLLFCSQVSAMSLTPGTCTT